MTCSLSRSGTYKPATTANTATTAISNSNGPQRRSLSLLSLLLLLLLMAYNPRYPYDKGRGFLCVTVVEDLEPDNCKKVRKAYITGRRHASFAIVAYGYGG